MGKAKRQLSGGQGARAPAVWCPWRSGQM